MSFTVNKKKQINKYSEIQDKNKELVEKDEVIYENKFVTSEKKKNL